MYQLLWNWTVVPSSCHLQKHACDWWKVIIIKSEELVSNTFLDYHFNPKSTLPHWLHSASEEKCPTFPDRLRLLRQVKIGGTLMLQKIKVSRRSAIIFPLTKWVTDEKYHIIQWRRQAVTSVMKLVQTICLILPRFSPISHTALTISSSGSPFTQGHLGSFSRAESATEADWFAVEDGTVELGVGCGGGRGSRNWHQKKKSSRACKRDVRKGAWGVKKKRRRRRQVH